MINSVFWLLSFEHSFHREGVIFTSPPFGGDFPLTPRESGCFLFPLNWFSKASFLPTSRVIELLLPPAIFDGGWASPNLFGLWWFVYFVFLCFFPSFGRIVHLKMSSLGEWSSQRVVGGMIFGPFFSSFFFDFGSQIYTSSPTFDWHAPPSRVLRRFPPLPLQDPVVSVTEDRCMLPTRLEALCYLVRVWARLHLFQAVLSGNWLYGVEPPSGWHRCRRMSFKHRRPASWPFSSTTGRLFWVVFAQVFLCFFLLFIGSQSTCVWFKFYGNICWLIARSGLFSLESEH
jgi:hypothetical protein